MPVVNPSEVKIECGICGKALLPTKPYVDSDGKEVPLCDDCYHIIIAPLMLIEEKAITPSRLEFLECS